MSKHIIVIIIVILVIGLSYGAYWYLTIPQVSAPVEEEKLITEEEKVPVPPEQKEQPQQIVTEWEIYENKEYNYSIKYPKGWCVLEPDPSDPQKAFSFNVFFANYACDSPEAERPFPRPKNIVIEIYVYPGINNLDEWLTKVPIILEKQEILVDGERAIRSKEQDPIFGFIDGNIRFINNNTGFQISYDPYDSELVNIFDQMLNSFKFTK